MAPPGAQKYLEGFINYELISPRLLHNTFRLKRVHELLQLLGDPQQRYISVHVAGSKGKGSTCAFVAHILAAAGYKVGLYTSPHLADYKERIRVLPRFNGSIKPVGIFSGKATEAQLSESLRQMRPAIERLRRRRGLGQLTYFEVLTALALHYFYRRGVEVAVLETGLGGRLDATNAVSAAVAAITPLSLEHTQFLGDTLAKIAAEKAGIIKGRERAVVLAPQPPAARRVLEKRCREYGLRPITVGKDITFNIEKHDEAGLKFSVRGTGKDFTNLRIPFAGRHQAVNAVMAVAAVESLRKTGLAIPDEAIRRGLARAAWPGRFEVVRKAPRVILDGAHNVLSCRLLAETFTELFPGRKAILILGVSEDKDRLGMARVLRGIVKTVIATRADHPRAHRFTVAELTAFFPGRLALVAETSGEALAKALRMARRNGVILVAGSLFVVGEVRQLCTK